MAEKKRQAETEEGAAELGKNAETAIKEPAAFHKPQLLASERYRGDRDLVEALLKNGEAYSLETVDKMIEEYKKGKVE